MTINNVIQVNGMIFSVLEYYKGSVLCLMMFLQCITCRVNTRTHDMLFHLYADDKNFCACWYRRALFFHFWNWILSYRCQYRVEYCLTSWKTCDGLKLNQEKSNFLPFHPTFYLFIPHPCIIVETSIFYPKDYAQNIRTLLL